MVDVSAVSERGAVVSEELTRVVMTWQADAGLYRGLRGVVNISVVNQRELLW